MNGKVTLLIVFKLLLVTAAIFFYVRWLEIRALFYPVKKMIFTPLDNGINYEDITFSTPDGLKLNGWFIRANQYGSVLIYCHGNAGNISGRLQKLKMMHEMGLNIFIFDYRGYGKSEGEPSEKGVYTDVRAAYDYLAGRPDVNKEKIGIYGASLGGAVAIDLAVNRKVAGLVVDSSFTTAAEMAKHYYPYLPTFFMRTKFDSIEKVKDLKIPKLFIHSRDDRVIPFFIGEKLFKAAPEPKDFLAVQGEHGEGHAYDPFVFRKGLKTFFEWIGFFKK